MESSQKNLCVGISLLGGVVGAVLAVMLAVGGLNASGGSVVYAFFGCLLTWAAASAALVKWPMVRKRGNTLTAMLILFLGLCLRLALFDYQSPDYVSFLSVWTQTMRGMTVREALTTPVGDYNMPYLYLILLIYRCNMPDHILNDLSRIPFHQLDSRLLHRENIQHFKGKTLQTLSFCKSF